MSGTRTVSIDPAQFRDVLGHYPTGVSVITGIADDREPLGMVVGTFASVSLDPPLVSFMPTKDSSTFAKLRTATHFCVNVLASDQEQVSRALARPGSDKLSRVKWELLPSGAPVIDGVVAAIDCNWHDIIEAGDHWIVLGAVTALEVRRSAPPLVFFQGGYGRFGMLAAPAFPDQDVIAGAKLAAVAQPKMQRLARRFGIEVSAFAPVGNALSVMEVVVGEGVSPASEVGTRIPLIPPFGEQYVAHAASDVTERWLGRLPPEADHSGSMERYRRRLEVARSRGWSALGTKLDVARVERAAAAYSQGDPLPARFKELRALMLEAERQFEPIELVDGLRYDIGALSSAVILPDGRAGLIIQCSQLPQGAPSSIVWEWIDWLTGLTTKLSSELA